MLKKTPGGSKHIQNKGVFFSGWRYVQNNQYIYYLIVECQRESDNQNVLVIMETKQESFEEKHAERYCRFIKKNSKSRIILMTTKAKKSYHKFKFKKSDILLFGRESAGVPKSLHKTIKNKLKIPINKKTRSLNVAMTVAIVAAEALRQNDLLK